jgi:hypothetical protein
MGEEAVAPGLEELGVEIFLRGGLRGPGECWKGQSGGCGGGELQHFAAGEGEFWHRGNLRTLVWIPNYGLVERQEQKQVLRLRRRMTTKKQKQMNEKRATATAGVSPLRDGR